MRTQLIAITTAGAIALSGLTAAPAKASPEDNLLKFLVGAVIVGAVINEANKKNKPAVVSNNRHHKKKKNRHHAYKPQKPKQCLRQRWTDYGWKTFYAKRCMINNGWERHGNRGWHTHRRHAHR